MLRFVDSVVRENKYYRKVLRSKGSVPRVIVTAEDFLQLPIFDKKNYLPRHSLLEDVWEDQVPPMAYASSGSSGKPTYWFRGDAQEAMGADIHENIFKNIFGIKPRDKTLVIICFSMGVWVAGGFTASCCREIARRGYNLTVITPGLEKGDGCAILRDLAPQYTNVILAGYPPFVGDILHEAVKLDIRIPRQLKIVCAGDKFSEDWRQAMMKIVGMKRDDHSAIISVYGSADATVMGYETPLTIFLRRAALKHKDFSQRLFGDARVQPALLQYDPSHIFIEEQGGELVVTAKTALPLIRYNIHDTGRVLMFSQVEAMLKDYELLKEARASGLLEWRQPFITLLGRTDVALTYYSLNIYPEHLKSALEDSKVRRYLSGSFVAYNPHRAHAGQKICVICETEQGVKSSRRIVTEVTKALQGTLVKLNSEYRKASLIFGQKSIPQVSLAPYGTTDKFIPRQGAQGFISIKGKKPKMLS